MCSINDSSLGVLFKRAFFSRAYYGHLKANSQNNPSQIVTQTKNYQLITAYRDVLSKNSHKFQTILSSRKICSFALKSFMMVAIALP